MAHSRSTTRARPEADGEHLDRPHYEALVIGSGFGGAVAACRLAQAGVDVAIAERGRRWPPGSFPRDVSRLDDGWLWLCDHGLYDARPLNDILAVHAAGFGGGSLVYANVTMRPPDEVFDAAWPDAYSREALEPYFDLVAHMLDVRPVPADPRTGRLPPKTRFMARAAERTGNTDGLIHPNLAVTFDDQGPGQVNRFGVPQGPCVFDGECGIGCNQGAKNSLDHNYLALAERHGAEVGVRTEAVHLSRTDDGYRVRLREYGHASAGREGVERDVTARYVFVCAGAIGTTELLLRSKEQYRTLPDLPSALGSGYSGNGDFLAFGSGVHERFEPTSGPVITTATLMRAGPEADEHWFVLEDGGYSNHLAKIIRGLNMAQLPADVAHSISAGTQRAVAAARGLGAELDHDRPDSAVLLSMGRDRADGTIELRGPKQRLHVTWNVTRNSPLYSAERAASAEVVRAFGGRPFGTPNWRLFRQPVTVHNLGGARMGTDPATGVVDADGEVFGHPGLYVLDGAALPGATGANPSMTIAAVAERCIEIAVRRMTGVRDWVAPQRSEVTPRDIPEDRAVRAVVARGPRRDAMPGVRFRERMRGAVDTADSAGDQAGRMPVTLNLEVRVPDLGAFLADPVHAAEVGGTVTVEGLTGRPVPVDGGTLHLMAAHDGGPRRTMDYFVPFADDDGARWLLQGSKLVEQVWATDPWRATTVLDLTLTPPDQRYEGMTPTGSVKISFLDVLRLPTTIRPTGTRSARSAIATMVRFGAFFVSRMLRAFLTPRQGSR